MKLIIHPFSNLHLSAENINPCKALGTLIRSASPGISIVNIFIEPDARSIIEDELSTMDPAKKQQLKWTFYDFVPFDIEFRSESRDRREREQNKKYDDFRKWLITLK